MYSGLNRRFRPKSNFSAPMWNSLKLSHYIFPCRLSYLQSRQSTVDVAFVCLWCLEKARTFWYLATSLLRQSLENNFVFLHRIGSYLPKVTYRLIYEFFNGSVPNWNFHFCTEKCFVYEISKFLSSLRMAWQWKSFIKAHVFDTSIRLRSSVYTQLCPQ